MRQGEGGHNPLPKLLRALLRQRLLCERSFPARTIIVHLCKYQSLSILFPGVLSGALGNAGIAALFVGECDPIGFNCVAPIDNWGSLFTDTKRAIAPKGDREIGRSVCARWKSAFRKERAGKYADNQQSQKRS